MSRLSAQEVTAGISFRALASLRKNGNDRTRRGRFVGDETNETAIVETPYRRLSVLDGPDHIIVRDACFVGNKCDVSLIHVELYEARQLAKCLLQLSDDDEASK